MIGKHRVRAKHAPDKGHPHHPGAAPIPYARTSRS